MQISAKYNWLQSVENAPRMIQIAIALGKLDTREIPGPKTNLEIIRLAELAGVADIYRHDEMAWCAVAMAAIAIKAGKAVPFTGYERLRAKSFLMFGTPVDEPMFGDILVFERPGGYHVGLYIGEDDTCYHVAGGNQGNQFSVVRIPKNRLAGARRPHYDNMPDSVKKIFLEASGFVSANEA